MFMVTPHAQRGFLLTPLREGRQKGGKRCTGAMRDFYSRPCGRGDPQFTLQESYITEFLLTPLREGRRACTAPPSRSSQNFYSRPCGRGDWRVVLQLIYGIISTHAPAGGATVAFAMARTVQSPFLLTPLREGRHRKHAIFDRKLDFYSRPCGRGDASRKWSAPLPILISTHAPAGGATISNNGSSELVVFLLTPLREGRPMRGDSPIFCYIFLLTPLREGRRRSA